MEEQQLDAAAIQAVATLAAENERHEIKTYLPPGEPGDVSYEYDTRTGILSGRRVAEPCPLSYEAGDTRALAEFVTANGYEHRAIYYDVSGITAIRYAVKSGRREIMVLSLEHQRPFDTLLTAAAGTQPLPSRKFWTMLRTVFFKALAAETIAKFKRVTFGKSGQVVVDNAHGRESVAQSIAQRVETDAGDLPETLVFSVGVYDLEEVRDRDLFDVRVAVDVFADQQAIALLPMAGELERARDQALSKIVKDLRGQLTNGDGVSVYDGPIIRGAVSD